MQDPSEDANVTNAFSAPPAAIVGNDNEPPNTLRLHMLARYYVKPLHFRIWRYANRQLFLIVGEETKTRKNGKQHGNSEEPAHTAYGLALASLFRGKDGRLSWVLSILHRSLLSHDLLKITCWQENRFTKR